MVSDNVPMGRHHGAPKHGDALLAGLVRCPRCGRKLTVRYTGAKRTAIERRTWSISSFPFTITPSITVTPKDANRSSLADDVGLRRSTRHTSSA